MCNTDSTHERNSIKGLYTNGENIYVVYFVATYYADNSKVLCYRVYGTPTFKCGPMSILDGYHKLSRAEIQELVRSFIKEHGEKGDGETCITPPDFDDGI